MEQNEKNVLENQVRALEEFIEVARTVVSTLDLDTLLQSILSSAMNFAAAPAGSIALYDDRRQELNLYSHAGLTADFVRHERWEVKPGGLTEQVLASREIVYIEDTGETAFSNPLMAEEGIRALVCVPLCVNEQVVGVLYLDDFVPRKFERDKLKLLTVLASFAAMAIDNAKLHNRTRLMAITDALTGLHNHRYFQQVFKQEVDRAKRYEKPLALIILDVDDFKKYNDTYGHFSGDQVLVAVGETISRILRRVDYAFRYGGEEFVVLLPESGLDSALQVAERLRATICAETAAIFGGQGKIGVSVSVGVACYPSNGIEREDLFNAADSLLYRAKELGKNRVYYFRSDGEQDSYPDNSHE
ncbi:sensor domain-containing diguanylate cyclase [Geobacter sp. DSM 9736]|uniref:sensor domain-containing diguanylate cyclase n=1 Tax=Geobacter sp. DSM 9736 TaxID=1277350 RepID=UPI000B505301|nr:sensor domain-containing diguanylate cyclase [Geobacter sp. DSM 9736]